MKFNTQFWYNKKSKKRDAYDFEINGDISLNTLNEYFTKLEPLDKLDLKLPTLKQKFNFKIINDKSVREKILDIKSNSTGPDLIPPGAFKILAPYIAKPIAILFKKIQI